MITKKNRLTKEYELKKHMITLNNLKKKLARSIVNKTCSTEDLRELYMEDLHKHAAEMEKERVEKQKIKLSYNQMPSGPERDRLTE